MLSIARQLIRQRVPSSLAQAVPRAIPVVIPRLLSTTLPSRSGYPRQQRYARDESRYSERRNFVREDSPPSPTLILRNLHYDAQADDIHDLLSSYGPLNDIRIITRDGRRVGVAYIDFESQDMSEKAFADIRASQPEMFGRPVHVDFATSRSPAPPVHSFPPSNRLWIADTQGVDLNQLFAPRTPDIWNPPGKVFGFATFDSVEDATAALNELNGKDLGDGKTLVIGFGSPRPAFNKLPLNERRPSRRPYNSRGRGGNSDWGRGNSESARDAYARGFERESS